ncbi:hypothetical protein vseg_009246 [Gypsophila vaccaria]
MNQNQCVPNWELDDVGPTIRGSLPRSLPSQPPVSRSLTSPSNSLSGGHDTSTQDYEMAELTWENGQLTMHGLGLPRVPSKNNIGGSAPWNDKSSPLAGDTLESIVNQATHKLIQSPLTPIGAREYDDDLVPLFNTNTNHRPSVRTTISIAMDALVPTAANNNREPEVSKSMMGCSTRVGSCSVAVGGVPGVNSDWSVSATESDKWHDPKRVATDTCEQLRSMTNTEMTSASFGASLDNTTRTVTFDDREHDSVCHSRLEKERVEEEDYQKKGADKSTSSNKRSRAAAVHNQSERKRRDKINQRMKTLQKLVPNSNKTDKASMLDEVIEYMKQLQSQIQMLNTMSLPSMMMPLAIQQQQLLQMSMMAPIGMPGMGLGMGMNMDHMNQLNIARPNILGLPQPVLNPAAYMPLPATTAGADHVTSSQPTTMVPADPLTTYLANQSQQSVTMDAYNRMAAMYQQLQQQLPNQGIGSNR